MKAQGKNQEKENPKIPQKPTSHIPFNNLKSKEEKKEPTKPKRAKGEFYKVDDDVTGEIHKMEGFNDTHGINANVFAERVEVIKGFSKEKRYFPQIKDYENEETITIGDTRKGYKSLPEAKQALKEELATYLKTNAEKIKKQYGSQYEESKTAEPSQVHGNMIEYATQELFKQKGKKSADKVFKAVAEKFNGKENMFLGGKVSIDAEQLKNAVYDDKIKTFNERYKDAPDKIEAAIEPFVSYFNLDEKEFRERLGIGTQPKDLSDVRSAVDDYVNENEEVKSMLEDGNLSKGRCDSVAKDLAKHLNEKGIKAKVIGAEGFKGDLPKDAHPEWIKFLEKDPKDKKFLWHSVVMTDDAIIDLTGSQYGKQYAGVRILTHEQFAKEWDSFKTHPAYPEKSEKVSLVKSIFSFLFKSQQNLFGNAPISNKPKRKEYTPDVSMSDPQAGQIKKFGEDDTRILKPAAFGKLRWFDYAGEQKKKEAGLFENIPEAEPAKAEKKDKIDSHDSQGHSQIVSNHKDSKPDTGKTKEQEEAGQWEEIRKKNGIRKGSYDDHVMFNLYQMKSNRDEWSAVPIKSMTDDGEGHIMPEFDRKGIENFKEAPTMFKSGSDPDSMCCGLCGHKIKMAYPIKNDTKEWYLSVGSECVTNFGEEKSGQEMIRSKKLELGIALINETSELEKQFWQKYHKGGFSSYNYKIHEAVSKKLYCNEAQSRVQERSKGKRTIHPIDLQQQSGT